MRKAVSVLMLIGLAFTIGCGAMFGTSRGTKVDRDKLTQVEKGVTTMEEVRKLLGKPQATQTREGGTIWTYSHTASTFTGAKNETVAIRFDANGVVAEIAEQGWDY